MKNIIYILTTFVLLAGIVSCNDDFLTKVPIDKQTEATAFKSYENFKTYSWGLYDTFADEANYTQGIIFNTGRYRGDMWAGYLSTYATSEPNQYREQSAKTPDDGGGWDFSFIRQVNIMLSNIDASEMTKTEKDHWRSVGYFFRAYRYMELISRFGDVPWIDKVVKEDDKDVVYGKRESRKTVADKVLADLQFAETNIYPEGDGANTINTDVVRALMSRFCLFEGTWRKYHQLGDESTYIDECIRVSELLASKFPDVHPNYDALNNSPDLSAYKGMILYKEYTANIRMHRAGFHSRTSSSQWEMPKYTVESYLSLNGKPIHNALNTQYDGDRNMYDEFRNRDYRLLMTVTPPYSMKSEVKGGMNPPSFEEKLPVKYNDRGFYTGTANTMEYADLLKQILPAEGSKRLPAFNWSGTMNWVSPNINGPGQGPLACRSGYYVWKFYNLWDENHNTISVNTSDRPIFFIEEVLLNLAEAKFEKGQFDQTVAENTINKLRPRAGVSKMVVAEIGADFDPKRDATVDPVLWEIRRERMVELMGEGFGFQDIRRWKKGEWYINRPQVGTYVKVSDYVKLDASGNPTSNTPDAWKKLALVDANYNDVTSTGEGFLKRFPDPSSQGKGWTDAYYLFPIPIKQQVLNPNLGNNPGWE